MSIAIRGARRYRARQAYEATPAGRIDLNIPSSRCTAFVEQPAAARVGRARGDLPAQLQVLRAPVRRRRSGFTG